MNGWVSALFLYDVLPAFRGSASDPPIREATVYHASNGELAIRRGEWVLIDTRTGDVSGEPSWFKEERGYVEHGQPAELFHLGDDPIQGDNRYTDHPEIVKQLQELLERYRTRGRSVPP